MTPPRAADSSLWARLESFDLDGTASFSFTQRLARENNWTQSFAQRVVLEYKRFVFLAATCEHPVTPSDEVDQAWHLHLLYTRSYWDGLCGQVLGFPLHHGPTQGGAAEGKKFGDWYSRTLQAYQAAFTTAPPADIWPAAAVRFGEAPHFRRINLRRHWLLPRPGWPFRINSRLGLALLATLLLVSCTARLPLNPLNWYGTDFLILFWTLGVVLLTLAFWLRSQASGPADEFQGQPLSVYEVARLANNGRRVADGALAALVYEGKLELVGHQKIQRTAAPPPTDPYERSVWNLVTDSGWSDLEAVRQQASRPVIQSLQELDSSLMHKGLLLPPQRRQQLNRLPFFTALALGAFGLAKVCVGVMRHRPVGYLLISLLLLAAVAGLSLYHYSSWKTRRGARVLRLAEEEVRADHYRSALSGRMVALSVSLFGLSELSKLGLESMATMFRPPNDSGTGMSSDGSSSSSDSGSSGDSGCGSSGCGGCGGD